MFASITVSKFNLFHRGTFKILKNLQQEMSFSNRKLTVYGHYVSQPARSVLWLLKINDIPFEFKKVEPLNGGTREVDFLEKFPTGQIPTIEDEDFLLGEGAAILSYLCETRGLESFYPTGQSEISRQTRAKIQEYMHNHHSTTRRISKTCIFPVLQETFFKKIQAPEDKANAITDAKHFLRQFESTFLIGEDSSPDAVTKFIANTEGPTIADLLAYCEIAQLEQLSILTFDEFPLLQKWINQMASLSHHDDVHQTLFKLAGMIQRRAARL